MNIGDASPVLPYIAPAREARSVSPAQPQAPEQRPAHDQRSSTPPPPEGVQLELWQVLSDDERAFLVEQLSLGPLTYSPNRKASADAQLPTGQRIDVKA